MTRKLHLFLLTLLMGLPMAVLAAGTSWQTATTLGLDGSASGTLSEDNTEAWYKIDVPENGALTLTVAPDGTLEMRYVVLYALTSDGELHQRESKWIAKSETTLTEVDCAPGTYYVMLEYGGAQGGYTLRSQFTPIRWSYPNDREPNNTWQQAQAIGINSSSSAQLGYYYWDDRDDQDWYKVEVTENGTLTLTVTPDGTLEMRYVVLYALTSDGELHQRESKWIAKSETTLTEVDCAPGTYYVKLEYGVSQGGYTLRSQFTPIRWSYPNDREPNNTWQQAQAIGINSSCTGQLGYYYWDDQDNQDWYKVEVPENGTLALTVTPDGTLEMRYVLLYALTSDGELHQRESNWIAKSETTLTEVDCAPGTYYVKLEYGGSQGGYTLRSQFTPMSLAFANDIEPNGTWQQANPLKRGQTATGQLGYFYWDDRDDLDWYKIEVPRDGTVKLTVTPDGTLEMRYMVLYALTSDGELHQRESMWIAKSETTLTEVDCAPGTYYVRLEYGGAQGGYALNYTFEQPLYAADAEPNDSWQQALTLSSGATVAGHLGYGYWDDTDNVDYYKVNLSAAGKLDFVVKPLDGLAMRYIVLYDANQTQKGSVWIDKTETKLTVDNLDAGIYYVRVEYGGGQGCYLLACSTSLGSVEHQKPLPDEDVTETEATPGTAWDGGGTIAPGSVVYQPMNVDSKSHWYQLTISDDGQADITISLRDGLDISSMTLYARNVAKGENESRGRIDVDLNGTGTLTAKDLAPGTYYLNIEHWSGDGYYTLTTRFTPCTVASDRELNDTWQQASQTLYPGQTMTGHMGYSYLEMDKDLTDWVKIHVPTDGAITLTLQPQESLDFYAVRLGFVKADGSDTEWQGASAEGGLGETVTLTQQDVAAGDYYLYMPHWSGYGGYTLSYRHEPNAYGNDREPNDTWQTAAVALEQGQTLTGHLGYVKYNQRDEHDWYVVNIDEKSNLDITVQVAPTIDLENLYLYRQNGSNIEQVAVVDVNNGETKTLSVNDLEPGTYFVDVHLWSSGYGHYFLSASKHIGTPDNPQPKDDTPIVPGGAQTDEFILWYVEDQGGGTVTYKLSEKPQVRLNGAEISVSSSRGEATFNTADVWKFTLGSTQADAVGIAETLAPVQPAQQGIVSRQGQESLVFSGFQAAQPVMVYSAGGRLEVQQMTDDSGYLELPLSSLRPGLYIVKAGSVTIKFMKK